MIGDALSALLALMCDSIRKFLRRTLPAEERKKREEEERKQERRFNILIFTVVIVGGLAIWLISYWIANSN